MAISRLIMGLIVLAAAWLSLPILGNAESFKCTDREGHAIYGDEPPEVCNDREVKGLRADGAPKRNIPAPESAREKAARLEHERDQSASEERERSQYQLDLALYRRYKTLEDLEGARQIEIDLQQNHIDAAEKGIAQCDRERERLDKESEFFAGRKKPDKLKREIEANEGIRHDNVTAESAALKKLTDINDAFDDKRKRYLAFAERLARAAETRTRHKVDEAAK